MAERRFMEPIETRAAHVPKRSTGDRAADDANHERDVAKARDLDDRVLHMLDRFEELVPADDPLDEATLARLLAPVDRGVESWLCRRCGETFTEDEVKAAPDPSGKVCVDPECAGERPFDQAQSDKYRVERGRGPKPIDDDLKPTPRSDHSTWFEIIRGAPSVPHLPEVRDLREMRAQAQERQAHRTAARERRRTREVSRG
jgi:hypothetical protein